MDLFELPPEVFGRIVAHLVTDAGIVEAWKQRRVCRTFRRFIELETLAKKPTRAFLRPKEANARGILRKNTALYLSYRLTTVNNAYSFLPRFMRRICNAASANLPENDYRTRRLYERTLCRLLVSRQADRLMGLIVTKAPESSIKFTDVTRLFAEAVTSNSIAAAAAVGDLQALCTALGDNPEILWVKSPLFGYPLAAAASGNHGEDVYAIVKHFEQTYHRTHGRYCEENFKTAINAAFDSKHSAIALILLKVVYAYAPHMCNSELQSWTTRAILTRNSEVIHQVLALRRRYDMSNMFVQACHDNDIQAVRMFVKEGFVPLHCTFYYPHGPLISAVDADKLEIVQELLKLGANPNSCCTHGIYDLPLWAAVENKSRRVVRVLLRYGANPELIQDAWARQSNSFRDARAVILALLLQAKDKQKYYVHSTVPRTNFAADAPDLVAPKADSTRI